MNKLQNKVAVVTGASRGIGREIARQLAAGGALVAAHYNSSEREVLKLVAEIEKAGGEAFAVKADLSRFEQIPIFVETLNRELSARRAGDTRIDILVNNAGVAPFSTFAETTEADFDRMFNVNVKSLFFLTQTLLPQINRGGRIINLSSVVARTHFPNVLAYSTTKGAVDVFTKHLAAELGSRGITVNAVAPGAIETDMSQWLASDEGRQTAHSMQALQRVGQPADIAGVAAFLATGEAGWITGQIIESSGGTKL